MATKEAVETITSRKLKSLLSKAVKKLLIQDLNQEKEAVPNFRFMSSREGDVLRIGYKQVPHSPINKEWIREFIAPYTQRWEKIYLCTYFCEENYKGCGYTYEDRVKKYTLREYLEQSDMYLEKEAEENNMSIEEYRDYLFHPGYAYKVEKTHKGLLEKYNYYLENGISCKLTDKPKTYILSSEETLQQDGLDIEPKDENDNNVIIENQHKSSSQLIKKTFASNQAVQDEDSDNESIEEAIVRFYRNYCLLKLNCFSFRSHAEPYTQTLIDKRLDHLLLYFEELYDNEIKNKLTYKNFANNGYEIEKKIRFLLIEIKLNIKILKDEILSSYPGLFYDDEGTNIPKKERSLAINLYKHLNEELEKVVKFWDIACLKLEEAAKNYNVIHTQTNIDHSNTENETRKPVIVSIPEKNKLPLDLKINNNIANKQPAKLLISEQIQNKNNKEIDEALIDNFIMQVSMLTMNCGIDAEYSNAYVSNLFEKILAPSIEKLYLLTDEDIKENITYKDIAANSYELEKKVRFLIVEIKTNIKILKDVILNSNSRLFCDKKGLNRSKETKESVLTLQSDINLLLDKITKCWDDICG